MKGGELSIMKILGAIHDNEILIDQLFIGDESFLRYYHRNNDGTISPTRYFVSRSGKICNEYFHILKPGTTMKGYQKIGVFIGNKSKPVTIHKIVAWTYHRDQWRPGYDVDHLNGIKTDNRADNLEWVSRKTNIRRAYATGLKHGIGGESSPSTRYSDELVIDAFEFIKSGHTIVKAANKTGIPLSMLYILVRGDSRKYLWDRYKFDRSIYDSHVNDYKLSVVDKISILELRKQRMSPTNICNQLGIPLENINTVYNWIYKTDGKAYKDIILDKRLSTTTTIEDALKFEEVYSQIE